MSLFRTPEEHAANPPRTWQVVKRRDHDWRLIAGGFELDHFSTQREAYAAINHGWARQLYDREAAWYAGRTPAGWRPWADVKVENEAARARRAGSGM